MSVSGGCLCGAVRYEIAAAPITTRVCWCRVCQRIGAGGATVNVCFPKAAARISGQPRDFVSTADSGNVMHRRFCPECGVHLFSEAESRPHLNSAPIRSQRHKEMTFGMREVDLKRKSCREHPDRKKH